MATVPYYTQANVKVDLRITDTSQDTQLDTWGVQSENAIDDQIYVVISKARLLTKLPQLPFTAGSVPQSIRSAADHYVMMLFYQFNRDVEMSAIHEKQWKAQVDLYVGKLNTDKIIFGRIAR